MKAIHNGSRVRHKDPVDVLRDDLATIKSDVASLVSDRISAMGDRARGTVSAAGESLQNVAEQARDQAEVAHKRLRKVTGSRPLTTIAIAATAGALGAGLLGWMKRR